ncbi:MAG TPA: helix-turn-helix transcriptional regulator [Myxococcota bacterium]|nr:helix-turn-helix transcriptional regulator [Myxococcota bacterium]
MTASTALPSLSPITHAPHRTIDISKLIAEWAHLAEPMDPNLVDALDALLRASPNLSLQQAARQLGVSSRTLQRAVSQAERSFVERRAEIRLEIACRRLVSTRDKVASIGYEIGFGSPSHFTLWFKQRTGLSPSELRARAERHRLS